MFFGRLPAGAGLFAASPRYAAGFPLLSLPQITACTLYFRHKMNMSKEDEEFMRQAITLAQEGMKRGDGGPFGCVIVKDGKIIGRGNNRVTSTNDPTAHAEVVAIREACAALNDFQLTGCVLYSSCEPCPMCLGAIYWSRPDRIVFAGTREDAADAGFDDQLIYDELPLPAEERKIPCDRLLRQEAKAVFEQWKQDPDKRLY